MLIKALRQAAEVLCESLRCPCFTSLNSDQQGLSELQKYTLVAEAAAVPCAVLGFLGALLAPGVALTPPVPGMIPPGAVPVLVKWLLAPAQRSELLLG